MAELTKEQIKQTTKWTKKEHRVFAMILLIIVAALAVVWVQFGPFFLTEQSRVENYVKSHSDKLEVTALNIMEREFEDVNFAGEKYTSEKDGSLDILYNEDSPDIVTFAAGATGWASETSYYGFYYSVKDEPWLDENMIQEGDGWLWQEQDGDNSRYTEKIIDNWYYYEMHF